MANLEAIRKRISSVKSTQKITRAMKMVAGARLSRAQQRIVQLRPYAERVSDILSQVVRESGGNDQVHPLLERRAEKKILVVLLTSDRGLCGAFNANLNKAAERLWHEKRDQGVEVQFATAGRRGKDYLRRRGASIHESFDGVWDNLGLSEAKRVARSVLPPFANRSVDAVYLIYNEFKTAMTQQVQTRRLLPLEDESPGVDAAPAEASSEYIFEPNKAQLFERMVPMYIEITLLRALYDSVASELGARMTAMDSATKNASDMIGKLTLQYNRQRQAVITTELIEIIAGAEALHG